MTQKTKTPTFDKIRDEYHGLIYCSIIGDWVVVIIFEEEGIWYVNYENRDPSERIYITGSVEDAIAWACVHHKQSVRKTFIGEPKMINVKLNKIAILESLNDEEDLFEMSTMEAVYDIRKLKALLAYGHETFQVDKDTISPEGKVYILGFEMWLPVLEA